ncbi:MAG: hypothetical protein AMXMBFR34_46980 [Myxococcaceae bacterium]
MTNRAHHPRTWEAGPVVTSPNPRPATPQVAPKAFGKLTLETTPWTTMYLGRQKLGDTPLVEQRVPAGRLLLRLSNPERSLESSVEVDVFAGRTTVKNLEP